MKKLLLPLLVSLLCIASSQAQSRTTSVSISVTDAPDGQAWANGSYATALLTPPGSSNGTASPGPSGALDGSGNATFVLTSQNDITFPTSGLWQVTVCPQMGCSVASYSYTFPSVLGATLSANLTPPSFRENALLGNPANAYRDQEVISSVLGSEYFNVTTSTLKFCSALPCIGHWQTQSSGGSISSGTLGQPAAYTSTGANIGSSTYSVDASKFSGVDPTGATDSYAGLQAAITAAIASSSELYLPPGTYKTSPGLTAPSNTFRMRGAGANITTITASGPQHAHQSVLGGQQDSALADIQGISPFLGIACLGVLGDFRAAAQRSYPIRSGLGDYGAGGHRLRPQE